LNEFREILWALLVVIEFKESHLSWTDSCTNEFINIAFIFRVEEEITLIIVVKLILELSLELYNMLQNKFFFWRVFSILLRHVFILLELLASLEFLILNLSYVLKDLKDILSSCSSIAIIQDDVWLSFWVVHFDFLKMFFPLLINETNGIYCFINIFFL